MDIFTLSILLVLFGTIVFGILFTIRFLKKKKEAKKEQERLTPTTQENLPVENIRGGIMKVKTGGYRIVIELPSINIDLMEGSEREQVLIQYRQVLNSFDFPFQYLQQSRVVDISEYINTLENLRLTAKSKFMINQLGFYSDFLNELIKKRTVLTKKFFLIIPYDDYREDKQSRRNQYHAFDRNKKEYEKQKAEMEGNDVFQEEQRYEKARKQLESRANLAVGAFRRFDINAQILDDEEVLSLLYTTYNKDRSLYQKINNRLKDFTTFRVDSDLREIANKRQDMLEEVEIGE